MTVKSILDIDVKDEKFQRFLELYQKYQNSLAQMPEKWKAVNLAQGQNAAGFEQIAAALAAHNTVLQETDEAEKKRVGNVKRTADLWTSMAKSSTTFAHNVVTAGASLLKWGGLVFGGLAAGSLWGMDHLASSASGTRRQSMGLGMSTGELQAFRTNFSRVVDPDAFLGTVNDIMTDPRKRWSASALGVGTDGSTEQTAVDLLKAMRSRARGTDVSMLGMLSQQTGVDVGTDVWRRLHDMGSGEFNSLIAGNRGDVARLGYSDRSGRAFTDFETQLERAKKQIEATFITGLVPLTPALSRLSVSVSSLIGNLMHSDLAKHGIDQLGAGIEWLGKKLSSNEFEKGVEDVLHSLGDIGSSFLNFAKGIRDDLPSIQTTLHAIAHPEDTARGWMSNQAKKIFHPDDYYRSASKGEVSAFLARIDQDNKLPAGTTARVWQRESSSSFDPANSSKGAIGPFQFMPRTAAAFGANPHSFVDSANAEGYYLHQLQDRYKGDIRKALAAYNFGPGNLDSVIKRYGNDWMGHVPAETRNYVSATSGQGVRIEINNNTGGNAVVSASQLGAAAR